ncbi:MAG: TrkH family potassium uptake protein [Spirochaetaceae bacterium]|jgi:trk system potassium uptake protein TrkH|nr:TrkH family potassium uptake protein [Spirochaetaceae bacterium]
MKFSVSGKSLGFFVWAAACLLGALPYFLSGGIPDFTDAVFESVSGFTTTGLSAVADLELLPKPLILWRAATCWLGGAAVVALSGAVFPLFGAGGSPFPATEAAGYEAGKPVFRIAKTARTPAALYLALTAALALLLRVFGMNWFDAWVHALSILSTGGFSSRNAGVAFYQSTAIEWTCAAFMILAGCNLTLIARLPQSGLREAGRSSEARAYGAVILTAGLIIFFSILPQSSSAEEALRFAVFHAGSILSTTGLFCTDYASWPPPAQGALFFALFIGGCTGSAAGGVKVIRQAILWKQTGIEVKKLVHPGGVFALRINGSSGGKDLVHRTAAFVFSYFLLLLCGAFLVSSAGEDVFTSLTASLVTLGNTGLGLGALGPFSSPPEFPGYVKWGLSVIMLLGRLELWTVLGFFTPRRN